jgi:hypothetical protein
MSDSAPVSDREKYLWGRLNEVQGDEFWMSFVNTIIKVREGGDKLSASELVLLQKGCVEPYGTLGVPLAVASFITKLLQVKGATRVLDPLGGNGLLGAYIAETLPLERVDILSIDEDSEVLLRPLNLSNLSLHLIERIRGAESHLADQYDAIVSLPPIGTKATELTIESSVEPIELNDCTSLLVMAYMESRLSQSGIITFLVPPRFAWERGQKSVRRNLKRLGLHLSALLELKAGIFPGTSSTLFLAIIERREFPNLFVAEMPEDADAQTQLIQRLVQRKPGPSPSMGRLTSIEGFHGLSSLEARERYIRLAKSKDLRPVAFETAVSDVRSPKKVGAEFRGCEEHPCAVYLPEGANARATVCQSDLPPELKSYLQLIVDPSVVLPEYLAKYLAAPIGLSWRQSVTSGTAMSRVSRTLLADSKLYLPAIADQKASLEAASEIGRLRVELIELESRLWDEPYQASKIAEAVHMVNHEERLQDWIETLPFPLASILRSYYAQDHTSKEKYERLLHFFEAFTLFCATMHVSAFKNNEALWRPLRNDIVRMMSKNGLSLERASFGAWRIVSEVLSGKLRAMLKNPDETLVACALYATVDSSPLKLLASTDLTLLIQTMNRCRNNWQGHGGAVTEAEANERHALLGQDLGKLREMTGRTFLQYQMVEPQETDVLDGPLFRTKIRRVVGSNPQLEHDVIVLKVPATKGKLYMHHIEHNEALRLIPFVQVHDAAQPASYFYNRCEKGGIRMVSYHFSHTSEMIGPANGLADLLMELKADDQTDDRRNRR